jgi:hypothetical protein
MEVTCGDAVRTSGRRLADDGAFHKSAFYFGAFPDGTFRGPAFSGGKPQVKVGAGGAAPNAFFLGAMR